MDSCPWANEQAENLLYRKSWREENSTGILQGRNIDEILIWEFINSALFNNILKDGVFKAEVGIVYLLIAQFAVIYWLFCSPIL